MGNRKEEILIVALHLFARDGYEAVSVSQIAGELDMTKGALYRHYKSKRDIFEQLLHVFCRSRYEILLIQILHLFTAKLLYCQHLPKR